MSIYRVDRAHVAVLSGILVMVAGVTAFVAFLLSSTVAGAIAVLLLLAAALLMVRPPVVARLDAHGLRARRLRLLWLDVENVALEDGQLVLEGAAGEHRLTLATAGRRTHELVREVYDRMNTAHGYTRWEP
ncbi:hypothetical protein [Aeromicrobium sp. CTD01-1L150]|uniref:hypothetical protein n=1 Tax=Aeromicrobium sp. CTD01-1L150 TaxID=3341830 RepID=UPI0035C1C065